MISEDENGLMQVSTDLWGGGRNQDFMNQSAGDASERANTSQFEQAGYIATGSGSSVKTGSGSYLKDLTTYKVEFNKHAGEEVMRELIDGGIDISYEGKFVTKELRPDPNMLSTITSAAGWIGAGFTAGGTLQAGGSALKGTGYWLGRNGKYYNASWGGNQWTGGRNFVQYSSRVLKGSGTILGVPSVAYNFTAFITSYKKGDMYTAKTAFAETISAGIGAFGGVPGIGWEAARYKNHLERKWSLGGLDGLQSTSY